MTSPRHGKLQRRISEAVYDTDTPTRDLAALARRLHEMLGDDQPGLERLRARVERVVFSPATSTRDLASLSRRLQLLDEHIEAIVARGSEGDELGEAALTPDESWDGEVSDL